MNLTTNNVTMTPKEIKSWKSKVKSGTTKLDWKYYTTDPYLKKTTEKTNYVDKNADINKAPASKEKDFNKTVGLIGNSPKTAQEGQVGVMPKITSEVPTQNTQIIKPQKSNNILF